MKKSKKNKLIYLLALVITIAAVCMMFAACSEDPDPNPGDNTKVLTAPTAFTFDPETGDYSFTANDKNTGYYFIRIYTFNNNTEGNAYVASSARINGGATGKMEGTVDLSNVGWGGFHVKLVSFAASGTDYKACAPVILTAEYGIGGILERPELCYFSYGNGRLDVVIDWYSLGDWRAYQFLPMVDIGVYSDEACTKLVKSKSVDTSEFYCEVHPGNGSTFWGRTTSATQSIEVYNTTDEETYSTGSYRPTSGMIFTNPDCIVFEDMAAGTYYVKMQAMTVNKNICSSSEAQTLKVEVRSGSATEGRSALFSNPNGGSAVAGYKTDRINLASSQTVTCRVVN